VQNLGLSVALVVLAYVLFDFTYAILLIAFGEETKNWWNIREFAAKEELEIVQPEKVACAGGRKEGVGGNSARPTDLGRNLFELFRTHTTS
jgi:hypothetical protein